MDFEDIEKKIGYKFNNLALLEKAMTHSSFSESKIDSYERLEFLGDSIVNFVIGEHFFNKYQDDDEGFLTKARAKIVSEKTLSLAMEELDIAKYIKSASGFKEQEVQKSQSVRADIFEAITGAIYLDSNLENAKSFILNLLKDFLNAKFSAEALTDYKSKLLEYGAKNGKKISFPFNLKDRIFYVTVICDGISLGKGSDKSKKRAEQIASKETFAIFGLVN